MKTTYFSVITLFLLLIFSSSCSDSYLNTEQQGVIPLDNFYKTDKEAFQGVLGCYDALQNLYLGQNSLYLMTQTMMSDEAYCGGSTRGDSFFLEEINEFRYGADNNFIKYTFTDLYAGVYKANIVLEKVLPDTDAKKIMIAEAKAFRAFFYFQLVVGYGDVPLVLKSLTPSEYAQPRAKAIEIWAQIEKDLNEAIVDLPLRSKQSVVDKARISKGTAQSILGKVYLFEKKYTESAAEFKKVIDSNEFGLNPDYSQNLRESTELGIESVFEVTLPKNMNNTDFANLKEMSWLYVFYSPKGGGWFDGGSLGIFNGGFGFVNAKQSLYQAFVDANDLVRRKSSILNEAEVKAAGGKLRNSLFATPSLPEGTLAWSTDPYVRLKYASYSSETASIPIFNFGTNVRVIRYADVLLMAAEANNRKPNPDDTQALKYINIVRSRVQLAPLTVTGDNLFSAIKLERRLELAFEGQRYQDLVRWGDAATVLKDQGKSIPKGDGTFYSVAEAGFKSKNLLFPIPAQEMTVNPKMTQNTGY